LPQKIVGKRIEGKLAHINALNSSSSFILCVLGITLRMAPAPSLIFILAARMSVEMPVAVYYVAGSAHRCTMPHWTSIGNNTSPVLAIQSACIEPQYRRRSGRCVIFRFLCEERDNVAQ
jgi:hypothetical protein